MTRLLLCVALAVLGCPGLAYGRPQLRSIYGVNYFYDEIAESDAEVLVLVFLDEHCPIAQQYLPTLADLGEEFQDEHVQIIGVYSAPAGNPRSMAEHALFRNISFRTYLDINQALTRLYRIERKPTALVLDPKRRDEEGRLFVHYRGAIDDRFAVGARRPSATRSYLREVLEDLAQDREPRVCETPVAGCRISFAAQSLPKVSYYKDVLPILQERCQSCHRSRGGAPMPLTTYAETAAYADMIAEVTADRRMPPWPGESSHRFLNDERLTQEEIDVLQAWAAHGATKGNAQDAPPPREWPDPSAWRIGSPDLVLATKPFAVPATGVVQYMYQMIPTHFAEDRFVQAIEVRTSAPGVVHHIQVLEGPADPTVNEARGPVEFGPREQIALHGFTMEASRPLVIYVPGSPCNSVTYPSDRGMRIRKGAVLCIETHYSTNGNPTSEFTEIGLIFRKTPPAVEVHAQRFFRHRGRFVLPPHASDVALSKDDIYVKNRDVRLLGIRMHLHTRGKSFLVEKVSTRDGQQVTEPLIWIPVWDFNWQRTYYFAEPIPLRGGESLTATAHWDNSAANPMNPDPTQNVRWGQQTSDEMMTVMLLYETMTSGDTSNATE